MKKNKKTKSVFPRLSWGRSPIQHPHSTKRGKRGYDRKRMKKQLRKLKRMED